jgi:hypothetical protein
MSDRDDEKTGRTRRIDEAEARSFEAEARAQEAKSVASRSLPKTMAAVWGVLVILAGAAVAGAIVTKTLASKADAKTVSAVEARVTETEKNQAVTSALLERVEKALNRMERYLSKRDDDKSDAKERRGR